jgi:thiol-disulfide isomerase/thioredoxin
MNRLRRSLLLAPLALPCATAWAAGDAPPPALGSRVPLADLPLLDGGRFRAAQAEGRVTVLYWWASWCPFCAEMSPHVDALWRRQHARGLQVLGIALDRTAEPARAYLQKKGYAFPSAWAGDDTAKALPPVRKVPTTWVRDRAGKLVLAEQGQLFPEDIEQLARFL